MIDFQMLGTIKGFMDDEEAGRLYQEAKKSARLGPILEIGSYCGKSAVILGTACQEENSILFSIDHHRGSEEQQRGQEYFDPDLYDERTHRINTFPFFRETLARTGLEDVVIPVVSSSATAGRMWKTPLAMVFIDGGHSYEAARDDFLIWSPHLIPGGLLVIHDIFMDPSKGGQAPRQVYEQALETGDYTPLEMTQTLGVLKRN
ncbi:class I SAM-dependent methyltransferase [Desulfospira joergensenii]|uniref:class I SAM-dependent methyltransferase n=1 Tax=Desulfospira joergensenii TaxID=53329 RepID=UPI0003B4F72B|nr:class I SAM-dependent methyltransferase [Desulfospira joergensenii]